MSFSLSYFARVAIAVAITSGISLCHAGTIGFSFSGIGSTQAGQTATYGFRFTPVVDLSVDSLGYLDVDANGLADGHRVGIWNSGGTLLASTTVTTANSTLSGAVVNGAQFRFTPITPLALAAGEVYTIGAAVEGSPDAWFAAVTHISNAPSLLTVSSVGYYSTGGFDRPASTIANTYAIVNLTVSEAGAEVPEPTSAALVGAGVAVLVALRRKRR